jgi:hypothetical protein
MQLLLLSLVLYFCTGLDIITDGGFDGVGSWNITPPVGLCRGWCHGSNVWQEPAHSGLNFVFANPSEGSVYVSQNIVQPGEEYNRCELLVYLRVVNVLDSQVLVSWNSQEYQFDLLEWEKDSELSESEWTQAKLLLYGTSDEIKFRLQTESITYISMDDVSLTCYKVAFYENPEAQLLLCIILIAVIAATLSLAARMCNLDINCCCNSCQKVKFEPIEEEDVEFDGFPLQNIVVDNLEKAVKGEGTQSASSSSSSTHSIVERK